MPTYHARSITVRLSSTPLTETITNNIVLKKGETAKRQCEAAEKKLLQDSFLNEQRVLFPGDRDGYEINWLGNAPYMQVQADSGFVQSSGLFDNLPRSNAVEGNCPHALAAHVKLSDKTFLSGLRGKAHLKIEVLFNGQLSACSLIHTNDVRSGAKSLHQVFAGYRVDFLAERPWVLLPPYTTADGGTRRFRKTISPSERWEQIRTVLLEEAEERGTDRDGTLPPSAEFLQALANMQMPESVRGMQKPGGRKYGVVDIVITAGVGNKLTTGTNYLRRPQRLKDSNYAVRVDASAGTELATTNYEQTCKAVGELAQGALSDVHLSHPNPVKDSDVQQEHPYKRRALSSVRARSRSSQDPEVRSPLLAPLVADLPLPTQPLSQHGLLPMGVGINRPDEFLDYNKDSINASLPANIYHLAHNMTFDTSGGQRADGNASLIPLQYTSALAHPHMENSYGTHLDPYFTNIPYSEPGNVHKTTGGPSFASPTSCSSPMAHVFGSSTSPIMQSTLLSGCVTPTSVQTLGPVTQCVAPAALIQASALDWTGLPSEMTSPYCPTHVSQQSSVGLHSRGLISPQHMPPNELPSLTPSTPHLLVSPAQHTIAIPSARRNSQLYGPPPPTAMFTVTSKPRRCISPTKTATLTNPSAPRRNMVINRFVINGLNGIPIIDHRWKNSRYIPSMHDLSCEGKANGDSQTIRSEHEERKARLRARQQHTLQHQTFQSRSRATSPVKVSQAVSTEHIKNGHKQVRIQPGQSNQTIHLSLPYLKKHQGPTDKSFSANAKIDLSDNIAAFANTPMPAASILPTLALRPLYQSASTQLHQPSTQQRRVLLQDASTSIQGPKAAPFLLDNPEERLREAARLRRSISPTKFAAMPSMQPAAPSAQFDSKTAPVSQGASSPLSSVPSSPMIERLAEAIGAEDTDQGQIPQLDGFRERTVSSTSAHKLKSSSPTKSPKSQCPGSAKAQPPVSPQSKKRKALHRSPVKPPRSPGRLKTVDNPPLNDDCVIAFAESIDKQEERGVLRQVKGEREGMFKEEYVVLAVRFFIAGD